MPYDSENNFFFDPLDDGRKPLSGPVEIDVIIHRGGKVTRRVYPNVARTDDEQPPT